jgi:tryptophan halogenase
MKKIVVLGGGTAGWLTALFLQKTYEDISIELIEDPNRPPIIAGESGTSTLLKLFAYLDISIADWLIKVNATPKLGGKFINWNGIGTEFIHALQTELIPDDIKSNFFDLSSMNILDLLNRSHGLKNKELYFKTLIANDIPLSDAFYSGEFIKQNKVPLGANSPLDIGCMWHYESRENAEYLKELGLSRDIKLILGEYTHSSQNESGNINSIFLKDGSTHIADWFFDCSGFASLLLSKVLKQPMIDFGNYFPARSVIAWWDTPKYQVTTNARAMKYGWSWNINLCHRSGNGYLYDPEHLSEDQALKEIHDTFGNHIEPIAKLNIEPGMMKNFIVKNVVGVGLSTGFMEPLEANGIAVIVDTLQSLYGNWNPHNTIQKDFDTMNDKIWNVVTDIRDYLCLHYRGHRNDTEFWKSHCYDQFRIPNSLAEKIEGWKLYYLENTAQPRIHVYSSAAWVTVIQGLNIFDTSNLKKANYPFLEEGKALHQKTVELYKKNVIMYPTIAEWIKNKGII